jgi:hypothetical protein
MLKGAQFDSTPMTGQGVDLRLPIMFMRQEIYSLFIFFQFENDAELKKTTVIEFGAYEGTVNH